MKTKQDQDNRRCIGAEVSLRPGSPRPHPSFSSRRPFKLAQRIIGVYRPADRNDRWTIGEKLFAAATLTRICPTLQVLDRTWDLWNTIAQLTFASGEYDAEAEIREHRMLTGASVKDSYLVLNNTQIHSWNAGWTLHVP